MTKSLLKKLKSQTGASFILALLFFTLCFIVASSILMASVSNAGKINSNREEHQKYLLLSSAVNLLCEDIKQSSYKGSYTYTEYTTGGEPVQTIKRFLQNKGSYSGKLGTILLADFDSIFAQEIKRKLPADVSCDGLQEGVINPHHLKITSDTGLSIDEEAHTVDVTLKVVEESYAIELTAVLDDYTIRAEMTPTSTKPTIPEIMSVGEHFTSEMTWEVGWITTGE